MFPSPFFSFSLPSTVKVINRVHTIGYPTWHAYCGIFLSISYMHKAKMQQTVAFPANTSLLPPLTLQLHCLVDLLDTKYYQQNSLCWANSLQRMSGPATHNVIPKCQGGGILWEEGRKKKTKTSRITFKHFSQHERQTHKRTL